MIEVRGLKKHYRVHKRAPGLGAALRSLFNRQYTTVKAVDGISFSIKTGESVGFLGPNGAGKTTTLKVLSGLLYPSEGEARVDGHVPQKREVAFLKKIMLVMGQKQQLLWDLPPAETFELNRAIYGLSRTAYRQSLDELVSVLQLEELLQKPVRQLSLGERMKCELAAALLHRPSVLFLDEPTIGLDVVSKHAVRQGLRQLVAERGVTVLLTTHDLIDVEELCPRVVIIDHGTVIYDGDLDELRARHGRFRTLVVDLVGAVAPLRVASAETVKVEGPRQWLRFDGGVTSAAAVLAAVSEQAEVRDLTVEETDIEEVVRRIYEGGTAGHA